MYLCTFIVFLFLGGAHAHYKYEDSYSYNYETESLSTPLKWFTDYGFLTRLRRHPTRSTVRTLSVEEVAGVKDALRQIMPNHNLEELFSSTARESEDGSSLVSTLTTTRDATPDNIVKNIYDEISTSLMTDSDMTEQAITQANMLIRWLTKRLNMPKESVTADYDYEYTGNTTTGAIRIKGLETEGLPKNLGVYFNEFPPKYGDSIRRVDDGGQAQWQKNEGSTQSTTKRTRRSKTTPVHIDIAKLMALVSNLTMNYQAELAVMLNKSLEQYTIPTCPTPTTTTTTEFPTTTDMYGNLTGTVMGKCFVCGLDDKEMPRNAHCADAFAGDFIPLVPMNPTARAHIAKFRKYCRWMNVPRYYINESEPRSMWGRWTGGCSVRWIDVSGIYTQRSCRNRHRATMGQHWVSKRMAKLEMALQHIDNGCIISPMASLVPLSRGISMYARFHACVCTGNWCNLSPGPDWSPFIAFLTFIVLTVL